MNEITVNRDHIMLLAEEGGKLVIKPSAEEYLIKLHTIKDWVDEAIESAKDAIDAAGTTIDPNFKGVIGDRVRCIRRKYGAVYGYGGDDVDIEMLKTSTRSVVDTGKVKDYLKEHGEMPDGVFENDREVKLSLVVK